MLLAEQLDRPPARQTAIDRFGHFLIAAGVEPVIVTRRPVWRSRPSAATKVRQPSWTLSNARADDSRPVLLPTTVRSSAFARRAFPRPPDERQRRALAARQAGRSSSGPRVPRLPPSERSDWPTTAAPSAWGPSDRGRAPARARWHSHCGFRPEATAARQRRETVARAPPAGCDRLAVGRSTTCSTFADTRLIACYEQVVRANRFASPTRRARRERSPRPHRGESSQSQNQRSPRTPGRRPTGAPLPGPACGAARRGARRRKCPWPKSGRPPRGPR